jgi:hypothetical protein
VKIFTGDKFREGQLCLYRGNIRIFTNAVKVTISSNVIINAGQNISAIKIDFAIES